MMTHQIFSNSLLASVLPLLIVVFLWRGVSAKSPPKGTKLPPEPPGTRRNPFISVDCTDDFSQGKFIVGHLPDIPLVHPWLHFKAWADQYGPIFGLNLMGRKVVVVSTEKIANELLRERGNLYSSREQLPMAAQLVSQNLRPLFLPYGGMRSFYPIRSTKI